jgi:Domain of unknown function (DUF5122) beta-propeller
MPDSSVDTTFDAGANDSVTAVAVQPDGKILVAGAFTLLGRGGQERRRAAASPGSTPTTPSTRHLRDRHAAVPSRDVGQPVCVGGMGVGSGREEGPGIDTLHVWAYPSTEFLGTPTLGGERPDFAAVYGDQFREVGSRCQYTD